MNGFAGVMLEEGTTRRKLHRMLLVASAVVFSLSVLGIAISSHVAILADNIPLPIVSAVFWRCVFAVPLIADGLAAHGSVAAVFLAVLLPAALSQC